MSDISCDLPTLPAHVLMWDAANTPGWTLWPVGRLDDLAWADAVENGTGAEINPEDPPRDADFLAARDACTDTACRCDVLVRHTDDSLGGTSPYSR